MIIPKKSEKSLKDFEPIINFLKYLKISNIIFFIVMELTSVEEYKNFLLNNDFAIVIFSKSQKKSYLLRCEEKCIKVQNVIGNKASAYAYIGNITNHDLEKTVYCVYNERQKVFESEDIDSLLNYLSPVLIPQDDNDFARIISERELCIIDFTATWCGPCKKIAPLFQELSREHRHIAFIKIDVDQFDTIVKKYNIMSMPTFVCLRNGTVVKQFKGANFDTLRENVKNLDDVELKK